jgi:hypothetical protein
MPSHEPGTFAELYEAEQQAGAIRPGRPHRKLPRRQFTFYLTLEQEDALSDLHHAWRKRFKVDRSDIVGLAIEVLALLEKKDGRISKFSKFESLKVRYKEELESIQLS